MISQRNAFFLGTATLVAAVFGCWMWRVMTSQKVVFVKDYVSSSSNGAMFEKVVDDRSAEIVLEPIKTESFVEPVRLHGAFGTDLGQMSLGQPIAGVVNHHALAADLLARFFERLAKARPTLKRIVILCPDHFRAGQTDISTTERDYLSEQKRILVDRSLVRVLADSGFVRIENGTMFEQEHGIGALVPFLTKEFPQVQIVPIAIRATIARDQAKKFGAFLSPLIDDQTVVVVSADMSHYLPEATALAHDQFTEKWLAERNIQAVAKATDAYIDNGPAFVTLFAFLQTRKQDLRFVLTDHSISSRYGGSVMDTTSYLTGFWTP